MSNMLVSMNMKKNTSKFVTLNLHRFEDWSARLPAIVALLKKLDPDVVFLQEVQADISFDAGNQIDILNEQLGYPYARFSEACIKTTRKGKPLPHPVSHGLGVLSKFPFDTEIIKLQLATGDTETRIIMLNEFDVRGEKVVAANVHFANSDAWAEAHFRETLRILAEKNISSIIAGDFNIKHIADFKDLYADKYVSSADSFKYVSYPKDGLSYDYILLPKQSSFVDFQCVDESVSDHKALYAVIGVN